MAEEDAQRWPGSHGRALLCPYEYEDPAFRRAGRLPNLRYGDQVRAVWVTRYDFETATDIVQIMRRSAQAGFNTVFFQVRGNGSTYYRSNLEPWSETYNWQYPGHDPLQLAIREAHARNMALHAWINVMPMWRGALPPANKDHMYWTHPEWSWYDQYGTRQPLNTGFYVSVNPCLPEARKHIVGVCGEIVSCYEIDGLHLDYIRFPNEPPVVKGQEYPRDKKTLELFQSDTGFTVEEKPILWDQWRCDSVTALLRDIRRTVKSIRPQVVLTAAVGVERMEALSKFQDVEKWWTERLLDAVVPMNYTGCHKTFRRRVEREWPDNSRKHLILPLSRILFRQESQPRHDNGHGPIQLVKEEALIEWSRPPPPAIVMGTSIESGDSRLHQKQLALALQRFGHFSIFSYSSLFGQKKVERKQQPLFAFLRILADASNVSQQPVSHHCAHPFRARDTFAHPEESFPYDQLHIYSRVPPGSASIPPLEQDSLKPVPSWKDTRKKRRFTSALRDQDKGSRRTARRNLLSKYRFCGGKDPDIASRLKLDFFSQRTESTTSSLRPETEMAVFTENWELSRMAKAAAGEDLKRSLVAAEGVQKLSHGGDFTSGHLLEDPSRAAMIDKVPAFVKIEVSRPYLGASPLTLKRRSLASDFKVGARPEEPFCSISAQLSSESIVYPREGVTQLTHTFREVLDRLGRAVWNKFNQTRNVNGRS